MPFQSLFTSYDPYEGCIPNPHTGLSQPTQLRLPGLLLLTHASVRGGIFGASTGLGVGVIALSARRLEHGLLAGGGRLGFVGMCAGTLFGMGAVCYRSVTDVDMDDDGVKRAGNALYDNGVSPWEVLSQKSAVLQGKIDKWTLGGAMGAAMAGFQAKRPLDASRCVPWGVVGALVAVYLTEKIDKMAREAREKKVS